MAGLDIPILLPMSDVIAPSKAPDGTVPLPKPRLSRVRWLRWLVVLGVLLLLIALGGFVALPSLIQSKLPQWVESQLKRKASIGEVRINPFSLRVEARDFRLAEAGGQPIAGFAGLVVDLDWSSLTRRAWHFAEIRLTEPQVLLDIAPDGRINLAQLIADLTRDAPPEKSGDLPRLVIDALVLERGRADFADRRAGYANTLTPLDLQLKHFSTLPQDKGPYTFSASTARGGALRWKGEISMNPLAANGVISGSALSLPELAAYLKPHTAAQVASGNVGFELPYRVAYREGALDALVEAASLKLEDLSLKGPGAAEPFLAVTALTVDKVNADYAKREVVVGQVLLGGGKVQARRDENGRVDVSGWLAPAPVSPSSVRDQSAATNTAVPPASSAAPASTAAATSSVPEWKATIAQIALDNVGLAFEDRTAPVPLTVALDRLKLHAGVRFESGVVPKVVAHGIDVALRNLIVGSKAAPPVRVGEIAVSGGEVDLAARTLKVANIGITDGQVNVVRSALGRLDLLDMIPGAGSGGSSAPAAAPPPTPAKLAAKPAGAPPDTWKALVGAVLLNKFTVDLEDQESAVALRAQDIAVKLTDLSSDPAQPVKFDAGLTLREGGKLAAQGRAVPAKGTVDATVRIDQLALKPAQPFLARYVKLKIADGTASAQGKLVAASGGGPSGLLRYVGSVDVSNLKLDEENGEVFAAWKRVAADQLTLALQPNLLDVPELRLEEINAKLLIDADRSLNATRLLVNSPAAVATGGAVAAALAPTAVAVAPTAATSTAASSTAATPTTSTTSAAAELHQAFPVTVRRVRVQNSKLEFADLSLRPQFGARIHELNGVINGLSTNPATRSQLELDGRVDEFGLARIRGELNPFAPRINTDVSLVFKNVDLVSASPYSMKFAGYKIASGKISLDLNYKVRASQLEGQNSVILDQLTLGERVDSPDALKLPLELALAILKDSDGKIDLDLPVSGSLDDPQFSYGAIVWKAITNVLTRIVTAPFRALGALFGISGDKLEAIDFDAGSAVLLPPEREKLKQVATVLTKRAQLKLAVPGQFNETADGAALKVRAVRMEVARRAGVRVAEGEEPGPADVTDRAVRTALRAMLTERHGAAEWDQRKLQAEQAAAGAPVSMLERAQRITQGEPQVADLGPLYRGIIERLNQSQPLAPEALQQLAKRRSDAIIEMLKGAGIEPARLAQPSSERIEGGAAKVVPVKLGLGSR